MNLWQTSTLLVGVSLALTGCASTKVVSQRDPAVADNAYRSILVDANLGTLAESQSAERQLAAALIADGYLAHTEEELFFSRRDYSEEEIAAQLDAQDIDAVLVLRLSDAGYESSYVPRKVTTRTEVSEDDGDVEIVSHTEESGGHDVARPWADYVAELIDRLSGSVVWYAELESKGQFGWGQDHEDLARATAKKLAGQLTEDRMLAAQPSLAAEKELFGEDSTKPVRLRKRSN